MIKASFSRRIIVLLVGALGLAQLLTLGAGLGATHRNVRSDLSAGMRVAESVFERLYTARFEQLGQSVRVLAADFGFRRAVASGDAPTMVSALENHAARAGATLAVLVDPDGTVTAATDTAAVLEGAPAWSAIVAEAARQEHVAVSIGIGATAYQLVAVPVLAPEPIAWLFMGFPIDAALAAELREVSGCEVSFVVPGALPRVLASTLAPPHQAALAAALERAPAAQPGDEIELGDGSYLTRHRALGLSGAPVEVLLQKSLSAALAPYYQLAASLAALSAIVLIIASIAGIALARSIIEPLRRLVAAALRIGEGDYAAQVEVASADEVGQLAATFNTMQREIAERERRIVHQAHHDALTGLPNRWLADDRLNGAHSRAQRSRRPFTIAILDLARFKQINDTLGHHVGDTVLQETARRIAARARRSDTVARLGGDDFLIILEHSGLDEAQVFIEALRESLTQPIELAGMRVALDFRIGLACYPDHAADGASLLRRAEIALYDAKDNAKRLVVYKPGRDEGHLRQLAIVGNLPAALADGQLSLHFQPKIDCRSGAFDQAEALVRWVHPRFGFIPPDEFISIIEQSGNIGLLTGWIIDRAVGQCRAWRDEGIDVRISINLSALDLLDIALPQRLADALLRHQVAAHRIVLEITESAVMQDPETALDVLVKLRSTGFRLAIDDFGTGYSSLAQLRRLPVDELKIDKSFILALAPDSEDAAIVRSTIELAHTLGLAVVAEGVETAVGWHTLREFGCDTAQGYLISRPLPVAEFTAWYRAQQRSNDRFPELAA